MYQEQHHRYHQDCKPLSLQPEVQRPISLAVRSLLEFRRHPRSLPPLLILKPANQVYLVEERVLET